jgi:hypothetical protein
MTHRPIYQIAREISKDWGVKVNYGAKPYLEAMGYVTNVTDSYGMDTAKSLILYFLSNAGTWRGDNAKRIKAELKQMVGLK